MEARTQRDIRLTRIAGLLLHTPGFIEVLASESSIAPGDAERAAQLRADLRE